jgi:hypothetical protein
MWQNAVNKNGKNFDPDLVLYPDVHIMHADPDPIHRGKKESWS